MTRSIHLTGSTGALQLIFYVESPAKVPHRMDLVVPGPQPEMRRPRMPQGGGSLMDLKIPLFTRKDEKDTDFKKKKNPTVVPTVTHPRKGLSNQSTWTGTQRLSHP